MGCCIEVILTCVEYRIAGILDGISFRGMAVRKVFADLIFVTCIVCSNIKFVGIN